MTTSRARLLAAQAGLAWRRGVTRGMLRAFLWSHYTLFRFKFDLGKLTVSDLGLEDPEAPPQGVGRLLVRVDGRHAYRLRQRRVAEIVVERGAIAELQRLRDAVPRGSLPSEFYVDLTHGVGPDCFWLARVGDEIAGLLWAFGPQHPSPFLSLAPDEREIRKVWVLPKHRGRAVFIAMLIALGSDLKDEGTRVLWGHIRADNPASVRSVLRLGGQVTGVLDIRRIVGLVLKRFTERAGPAVSPKTVEVGETAVG